MKTLVLESLSK